MTSKNFAGAVSYLDKIVIWQPKSNSSPKGDAPHCPPLNKTLCSMFPHRPRRAAFLIPSRNNFSYIGVNLMFNTIQPHSISSAVKG